MGKWFLFGFFITTVVVIIIQNPVILVNVARGPVPPLNVFVFYFLHDPCTCSFSFSCFPVVDLFSHTGDFIDDVNILNILIGNVFNKSTLYK